MDPADESHRRRRRWPIALAVLGSLALVLALEVPQRVLTYWVAKDIERATSADEETEALCRANRWFHDGLALGYSVRVFDRDGAELQPWKDGSYDRVARVVLRWSNGREIDRTLVSTRPLSCVFGE